MRFLPVTLFTALATPFAGAQTLAESVRQMLAYEPELLAVHADTHSAEANVGVFRSGLLPQLSVDASAGGVKRDRSLDGLARGAGQALFAREFGICLRQLLYDGGAARLETRSARHAHAVQSYTEKSMIEARVVDLSEVYLEVIRTGTRIEQAAANIGVHERIRERVHRRAGVGGTRTDVNLVDSRIAAAKDALVAAQLARKSAMDRFLRLIGQPPGKFTLPPVPAIPAAMDEVDLSQNWNYLSAESAFKSTEDKKKAVDRSSLPKVYLDAGMSKGEDLYGIEGADDSAQALITLQWQLMNGGSRAAASRREGWQVVRAHELVRAADLERNYRLATLWREREGDLSAVQSLQAQVHFLEKVATDFESQFAVGKRDLLDILDAWNRHYEANTRLTDAEFNLQAGCYRILGVQGRLVEFLLGPECWIDLVPTAGKEVVAGTAPVTATAPLAAVPHPHHPDEPATSSTHPMQPAPGEVWEFVEATGKGIRSLFQPRHEESASPPEPRRGLFKQGGLPVLTSRPRLFRKSLASTGTDSRETGDCSD